MWTSRLIARQIEKKSVKQKQKQQKARKLFSFLGK